MVTESSKNVEICWKTISNWHYLSIQAFRYSINCSFSPISSLLCISSHHITTNWESLTEMSSQKCQDLLRKNDIISSHCMKSDKKGGSTSGFSNADAKKIALRFSHQANNFVILHFIIVSVNHKNNFYLILMCCKIA